MAEAHSAADEPTQLPGSMEGQDRMLAVPGRPCDFARAAPPVPRRAPPPPTAYAPPPWLAPPSVDPPFEAPVAPPSPSSLQPRDLGFGREHITLSQLQEFLAVEQGLKRSCQTLPLTIALWISFVLLIFSHGRAQPSFESAWLLREAVEAARVPGPPGGGGADLTLGTLREADEVLPWVEEALVPVLTVDGLGYGQLRQRQQVLGWVRMTQTRGPNGTACEDLSSNLKLFHSGGCHPTTGAALGYGPHDLDRAFRPSRDGDSRFEAWLEIGRSLQSVQKRVRYLRDNQWLGLSTQELVIEAAFLNSEAYIFSHLLLTFRLHREGWLETRLTVQPLWGDVYPHWSFVLFDIVWIALILFLLHLALREARSARKQGLLRLHLRDPYVLLDLLSVLAGLGLGAFYWVQVSQIESFESYFAALGQMPEYSSNEAPATRVVQATLENYAYESRIAGMFWRLRMLNMLLEYHRLCSFLYIIAIVARYFRGLVGQPRLAVFLQTMMAAGDFFLYFCIVFVMVFGNFALGGYILFGEHLESWSTLGRATSSLFSVLFGEFDYNVFHGVAPITAACWFWFFYVFVVLLLMGILSAAILDVYLGVRERLGEPGAALLHQVLEHFSESWWFRSYEGSKKSVPDGVLLETVVGDTDPAVIQRLGRMMIDRRLRTREDLAKAEGDPAVDEAYLVERGCDSQTAERLLERCTVWKHQMASSSSPAKRLMVLVARQITHMRIEASTMRSKMRARNDSAARAVDRLDLKHAKCAALARRIRKAQEVPAGWTALIDENGRRYLRQEATGLTSWTLPRTLV